MMETTQKLRILADAAKYDASCASSGSRRANRLGGIGNAAQSGICHSWSADGRCISLLKILMSNDCRYDCCYCPSRRSNDIERATFTPEEVADLTINFYLRNYIEGLFLSSAVYTSATTTLADMVSVCKLLRKRHHFNGYIHLKIIPGADRDLVRQAGFLADRMSVNIEFPSEKSLKQLAPQKSKSTIIRPMRQIGDDYNGFRREQRKSRHAPSFCPGGQSTQMIVGATGETDLQILRLSHKLYDKIKLKRVYYSAYTPVNQNPLLPALTSTPPLLREHRLYQADWLLRFYQFDVEELLTSGSPHLNEQMDPKAAWALRHFDHFPIDINRATYEELLRVPGIGIISARRIVQTRRVTAIRVEDLKKIGLVFKRAQYFISINGHSITQKRFSHEQVAMAMYHAEDKRAQKRLQASSQLSLF